MVQQVFYSFHYDNDVFRVQQIRNIGALQDNKPISANEWETVKRGGDRAIENWIESNMKNRSCIVVLVGQETAKRKWVDYEIKKAWTDRKAIVGIFINDLIDPRYSKQPPLYGRSYRGESPFDNIRLGDGSLLSSIIECHAPPATETYKFISTNIENWVDRAIKKRKMI